MAGREVWVTNPEQVSRSKRFEVLDGERLQPRYVAKLIEDTGWTGFRRLIEGIAIVYAESQGYTHAVGPINTDGTIDRGIWQINSRWVTHGAITEDDCFDPVRATAFARVLYKSSSYTYRPWAAYTSGRWEEAEYLSYATRGAANLVRHEYGIPVLLERS